MNGTRNQDLLGCSSPTRNPPEIKPCSLLRPPPGKKRRLQDGKRLTPHTAGSTCAVGDSAEDEQASNPLAFLKGLFSLNEATKTWMEQQREHRFARPSDDAVESYDLIVVRAIRERNTEKLRLLLHSGKKFDAANKFGESLIHMACRRGDINVIKFLIEEAGVAVDVKDDFGRTPLHDACWTSKPNLDVVGLLLKKVPPTMLLVEDVRGHTPFHYARREHWPTWVAFLREQSHLILKRASIMQGIQLLE